MSISIILTIYIIFSNDSSCYIILKIMSKPMGNISFCNFAF